MTSSGPARTGSRPTATRQRAARVLTEVLAPWVLVLVLPAAVALGAARDVVPALLWGLVVALTSSILPMAVIVRGARTGRWQGHHVRDREGRLIPFLVLIASSLGGLVALLAGGAPWPLVALDIGMISTLLLTGAITAGWKVSMHTAVAGGAVVILAATYSASLWALSVLVAAIGWSRVELGDHTRAQVVVGAIAGALGGGAPYAALL